LLCAIQKNFEQLKPENTNEILQRTKQEVSEELKKTVSPEFMNRIDEIIMFTPLTYNEIKKIVELQFNSVRKQMALNELKIDITPMGINWLARVGYNPQFGARPVKRAIQRYVLDEMSLKILKGEVAREKTILVDYDNGQLTFNNVTDEELVQIKNKPPEQKHIEIPKEVKEAKEIGKQSNKKPGFFARIGGFFKRLFGKKSNVSNVNPKKQ